MFSDHNRMKLGIDTGKFKNFTKMWKINSILLNNQ